jgi:hypothetical protein
MWYWFYAPRGHRHAECKMHFQLKERSHYMKSGVFSERANVRKINAIEFIGICIDIDAILLLIQHAFPHFYGLPRYIIGDQVGNVVSCNEKTPVVGLPLVGSLSEPE